DAPADERKAARSAVERLEGELERYSGLLPERGWVCFATADKVWYAGPSPAPMPDLARWEDGAHITPYMRALKQSRPITVVVADQRRARILEYLHGELNEENVLEAEMDIDSSSSGSSKRAVTRSGMRGESPDDAAQRAGEVATERMLRDVV